VAAATQTGGVGDAAGHRASFELKTVNPTGTQRLGKKKQRPFASSAQVTDWSQAVASVQPTSMASPRHALLGS
jgi:hypothetical protein